MGPGIVHVVEVLNPRIEQADELQRDAWAERILSAQSLAEVFA